MKCPKCGRELVEGKLLCEYCGEEVTMVPEFDIELETEIRKNLSNMVENMSLHDEELVEDFLEENSNFQARIRDYFLLRDNENGKEKENGSGKLATPPQLGF